MLRKRRQRFERLLVLRQRELAQKQASLARAQQQMKLTRLALEEAQGALRSAALAYRVPEGQSRRADDFVDASAWLENRVRLVEQALIKQGRAKEAVHLAQKEVQQAELGKRQIETLLERISEEERVEGNRREQIEQDEIASRLSLAGSSLGH